MAKVTSEYQVSIPRRLADRLSIAPGDDIEWSIAGEELRISRPLPGTSLSLEEKLAMFDAGTRRQAERNRRMKTDGLSELISEDFQHDRRYGTVRVIDPFGA